MIQPVSTSSESRNNENLDLVLAYILGDVTEPQRYEFETRISAGDPELADAYYKALDTLGALPGALTSAIPPPFVKERVMARVHEDNVQMLIAEEARVEAAYRPPMSLGARILGLIPGYRPATGIDSRPAPRRRKLILATRFASVLVVGYGAVVASAHMIEHVSHMLHEADQKEAQVVESVRHRMIAASPAFQVQGQFSTEQPVVQLPTAKAVLMPKEEPAEADIQPVDVNTPAVAATPEGESTPISEIQEPTETVKADLSTVNAQFYYSSDPTAIHFSLLPVNEVSSGSGRIYWSPTHAQALVTVHDLSPTSQEGRYTLYYALDDGTLQRMKSFTISSGANLSFFLKEAPNAHVIGARLVLETGVHSGHTSSEPVLSASTRIYADKSAH